MKTKMKKTYLVVGIVVLIVLILAVVIIQQPIRGEEQIAPDGVDVLPELNYRQCLSEIKKTNPEMNEQQAQDNCYTLQAIQEDDITICDKVSRPARTNCLRMFQ
jgi:hypothetical protein